MKDISFILARILLKVAKKDEVDAISKWKNISEENASFADGLEAFWNLPVEEVPSGRLNSARERLLIRLNSNVTGPVERSLIYYLSRIIAAIVIVISIAGLSIYIASETNLFYKSNWVEISTGAGQQSKVSLPDGSLVWLNAETVVKYHPDKKERKVSLTGEAYFEVNHSPDYPFVVETGDAKVEVLGTKFNVSHYPGSKITEASLLSGKITMSVDKNGKSVDLNPGEKVIYHADKQILSKTKAKVQNGILWRQGILFFENEPFEELILKLERYYAVKFTYEKDAFENIHYTGTINNLNITNVLEFINLTIPINYEIDNKTIKLNLKK
ncbi:MAG: FecR family protein [Mangrovibacterium sp.]